MFSEESGSYGRLGSWKYSSRSGFHGSNCGRLHPFFSVALEESKVTGNFLRAALSLVHVGVCFTAGFVGAGFVEVICSYVDCCVGIDCLLFGFAVILIIS